MNPSLLLIPDRYKASKLYSQIPDSGAGDLAFTRALDTATRVNSAGLIEKVRTNRMTFSEQLDNAAWTKQFVTVTANATAAPNGSTTADKLISTAETAFHGIFNFADTLTGINTFSFFAKKSEYNFVTARDQFSGRFTASFNLDTGVVSSGAGASIEFVGSGWYRCSIAFDGLGSFVYPTLTPSPSDASINYLGDGTSGIFIWGAQLETGDIATPYIPTTTAAVSVGMLQNIPRIDYTGGGCGKLLLEPQRTNLALFSEQLNNAEYTVDAGAFSANAGISPDGFINAELLTENSSNAGHGFYAPVVARGTTGQPLTTSIFAKANGRRYISLIGGFDSGNAYYALFDLQDGVVAAFSNTGSTTYIGSTITNFGNGWYRCTLTGSTTLTNRLLFSYLADSPTGISALGIKTYTGNGTAGVFLYGLQAEAGSYATSYIPTLGASVTRSADSASKTGISSLIGQTEGVIYAEILRTQSTANDLFWITLSDGSINNWLFFGTEGTGGRFYVRASNTVIFDQYPAISLGRHKLALAYKSGSIAVYIDGVQLFTSSASFTIGSLTGFALGQNQSTLTGSVDTAGAVIASAVYPTRLTNAELAALTTL